MSAISTGVSLKGQADAASANKKAAAQQDLSYQEQVKANQLQQQQADLQAARQRRDAIRQARIASGNAENSSANGGTLDTSNSLGGLASIQSQLGDSLSFLDETQARSDQASTYLGNAAAFKQKQYDYQSEAQSDQSFAQTAQSIGSLANFGISHASQIKSGIGRIGKIFGG